MKVGDMYLLVDLLGRVGGYKVTDIEAFQAIPPDSLTPDLTPVDQNTLEPIGDTVDSDVVYDKVSGRDSSFQTCIGKDGESSWGREFVESEQINLSQLSLH
jgi:hypothetical protein